ncbi:MAG: tetratricopeptide repeat protein [bacterium]
MRILGIAFVVFLTASLSSFAESKDVAIMDLATENKEFAWLKEGIREVWQIRLRNLREVQVVDRGNLDVAVERLGILDSGGNITGSAARKLLIALDGDLLLTGGYEVRGDSINLRAQIFDSHGKEVFRGEMSDYFDNILTLQTRFLLEIAEKITDLTDEEKDIIQHQSVFSISAYEYWSRGNAQYYDNNYDSAIKEYYNALEIDDKCEELYYSFGRAYLAKGTAWIPRAIEMLQKAVSLNNRFAEAHRLLGFCYHLLFADGLGRFERGDLQGQKPEEVHQRLQDLYNGAASEYLAALKFNQSYVVYNNLADLHNRAKNYDEALRAVEASLKMKPTYAVARITLAEIYERSGENLKAVGVYRDLARDGIRPAYSHWRMAVLYAREGDYKLALREVDESLALAPEYNMPKLTRAEVYERMGERVKAIEAYKEIQSDPEIGTFAGRKLKELEGR